MEAFVKIVFPLEVDDDGYPPISSESLNARRTDAGFVLDNTPFFVTEIAFGDLVEAEPIPDQPNKFLFVRVLARSTSKALSIILMNAGIRENVSPDLTRRGCYCESGEFGAEMLAVQVPESCDYGALLQYLESYKTDEQLSYAELAVT